MRTRSSCNIIVALVLASCAELGPGEESLGDQPAALTITSVTASGAEPGNPAQNAVDGSLSTRWSSNGVGQWIRADLGSVQSVSSVSIAWYQGNQRVSKFQIAVSQNGSAYTTVYGGSSSGKTTGLETYSFATTSARY